MRRVIEAANALIDAVQPILETLILIWGYAGWITGNQDQFQTAVAAIVVWNLQDWKNSR